MQYSPKKNSDEITLAIHSTDDSFGFAYRTNNNNKSDTFFIKKFDHDLCNNLIVDFSRFLTKENIPKIKKISVSIGPANFNASRLIVVLARTISQQTNCPLDSFSCFELMSKRIALKNNIYEKNKSFWIYKKLKRKGFIAGHYEVCIRENQNLKVTETIMPSLFKELRNTEPTFEANFDDKKDLKELLNLSNKNKKTIDVNAWEKVLPLYPLSPIN